MGHWVRLPGTQAHQSLATLRSGMENSEVEEEGRHWGKVPGFPPNCQDLQRDGSVLIDSGLQPEFTARIVGKNFLAPTVEYKIMKGKWG